MTSGNLYLLAGQAVNDNVYRTNTTHLIADSFEETQVMTGAISAEYGNVDGGVVNTITKSGGNEFTGLVRMDFSNAAWNAYGAMTTDAEREAVKSLLNRYMTYSLGGYILKDRLWFYASLYQAKVATAETIDQAGRPGDDAAGTPYTQETTRNYMLFKLTYRISDNHSVIGTYTRSGVDHDNVGGSYVPGELRALVHQREESSIWNVSMRSVWSPSFNTEIRFGAKNQMMRNGPQRSYDPNDIIDTSTIYDLGPDLIYNISVFGNVPSNRDNQTANAKGSFFANWLGAHELDFGFDYYLGKRDGVNMQSISGLRFNVNNYNPNTRTANPDSVIEYYGENATAEQLTYGFYINDRWKINNHFALQVGVRWDTYEATATDFVGTIASASSFSPRFGVSYDLLGDQRYILKASYCSYTSGVMERISGIVSGAGAVSRIIWDWTGDKSARQPLNVITDMSKYTTFRSMNDPAVNVFVDPDMKSPTCDEIQVGAAYSLDLEKGGNGFASLTYVTKKWKNMIDFRVGSNHPNKVTFTPPNRPDLVQEAYTRFWGNEPLAQRDYSGLELVIDWTWRSLHVSGNATHSTLEGNYEGEGDASPAAGQGLSSFRILNDVEMFSSDVMDPYGYLGGHRPLVMNWTADYFVANRWGRTAVGYIFRMSSGTPYLYYREMPTTVLHPDLASVSTEMPLWYQAQDNKRTHGKYNDSYYHDLSITHDFNAYKVAGYQLRVFAKAVIQNFFNHQQLLTWANPPWLPGAALDDEWKENERLDANEKRGAVASGNFGTPRTLSFSVGIRF
jgi:hypothetical protein